jgi:spore germination protein GerM
MTIVVAVAIAAREPLTNAWQRLRGEPAPAPLVTVRPLVEPAADSPQSPAGGKPAATVPGTQTPGAVASPASSSSASSPVSVPAGETRTPAARKARLFFATVDDSGTIAVKSVVRTIPASDSPLRDTLQALLNGPSSQELNLGLVSMVPAGAVLRGVVVRGDTAEIDFSESFRFNSQGLAAMTAQLRQIVYAATEFTNVHTVQILIEGKRVTYLGTEGVRIDAPLSRASFQK